MNSFEVQAKFGRLILSFAYEVCLELGAKKEEYPFFASRMRERFKQLSDEDLGAIFNYSMMETR